MATNSSPQIWKIEHPCPQCGAQVLLDETDRILRCEYCRNRLYIAQREHFEYFITPKEASEDLIFLPYWRFRGMMFSYNALQVEGRIIDASALALGLCQAPVSLGMRPQVLKLRFVTPGISGAFLKPRLPFRKFLHCDPALPNLRAPEKPPVRKASSGIEPSFIGETVSIIYSPVSVRGNTLFDEVLQTPFRNADGVIPDPRIQDERGEPGDQLVFFNTMCPDCGWDMEGEKNSLVLFCRNCTAAWECRAGGPGFEKVKYTFPRAENGGNSAVYLPFWRLDSTIGGLQLSVYADLARLANLPTAPRDEWASRRLRFWVPAFKIQPNIFLRLSRQMTVLQPELEDKLLLPKSGILPVTLPQTEALETLKVLIASMGVPKDHIFNLLPSLSYRLNDQTLVYLGFMQRGQELIQEDFEMSIHANSVTWGQYI